MKSLHYIVLILFLISCGAKKKQSSKDIEISSTVKSKEIVETSKDTLSFQKWSWIQKSNFKFSPQDPTQPSTVQYDEDTNTFNFQNATIESKEEEEVSKEQASEGKETTSEQSTNDETTDITGSEAQSESREQWKFKVWHLAPFLAVIGVVYLLFNYRKIILKFIKRKLLKIFNL